MADRNQQSDTPVDLIGLAFSRAADLQAAKGALYDQMAANRRMLRDLAVQGLLNDEQSAAVTKLYPPKSRKNKGGEADAE